MGADGDRDVVVVSDTSVLIDLERGRLLEVAFRLPFAFAVPGLLYEQELKAQHGSRLIELGLRDRRVGRRRRDAGPRLPEANASAVVAGLLRPCPRCARQLDTSDRRFKLRDQALMVPVLGLEDAAFFSLPE